MSQNSNIDQRGAFITKKNLDSTISLPSGSFPLGDVDLSAMSASKLLGGGANQFLRWVSGVASWITLALADITTALGYTPPNPANYNTLNNPTAYGANDLQLLAGADILSNVITTTATRGFIRFSTCAGTPTGIPTNGNGSCVLDTTNNKFYIYYNATWNQIGGAGTSQTEIQFLAAQAALGNLIEQFGTRSTVGVVCSYTVPNGKTFTLYKANFFINNGYVLVQLRNNAAAIETRGHNTVGIAGNIFFEFVTRGDQMVGNGIKIYDLNNSVNGGGVAVDCAFVGYIA